MPKIRLNLNGHCRGKKMKKNISAGKRVTERVLYIVIFFELHSITNCYHHMHDNNGGGDNGGISFLHMRLACFLFSLKNSFIKTLYRGEIAKKLPQSTAKHILCVKIPQVNWRDIFVFFFLCLSWFLCPLTWCILLPSPPCQRECVWCEWRGCNSLNAVSACLYKKHFIMFRFIHCATYM